MRYWVIEHINYGVFTGYNWNKQGQWAPHFKWSIPLYDGARFSSKQQAKEKLKEIDELRPGCKVSEVITD